MKKLVLLSLTLSLIVPSALSANGMVDFPESDLNEILLVVRKFQNGLIEKNIDLLCELADPDDKYFIRETLSDDQSELHKLFFSDPGIGTNCLKTFINMRDLSLGVSKVITESTVEVYVYDRVTFSQKPMSDENLFSKMAESCDLFTLLFFRTYEQWHVSFQYFINDSLP